MIRSSYVKLNHIKIIATKTKTKISLPAGQASLIGSTMLRDVQTVDLSVDGHRSARIFGSVD